MAEIAFGVAIMFFVFDGFCKMEDYHNFEKLKDEWKKTERDLKDKVKRAEKRFEEETAKTRAERKKLMDERQSLFLTANGDQSVRAEPASDRESYI